MGYYGFYMVANEELKACSWRHQLESIGLVQLEMCRPVHTAKTVSSSTGYINSWPCSRHHSVSPSIIFLHFRIGSASFEAWLSKQLFLICDDLLLSCSHRCSFHPSFLTVELCALGHIPIYLLLLTRTSNFLSPAN